MSRKLMATAFLVTGTLFAASVFGGDLTTLVQKIPAMLVINDDAHAVPVRDLDDPGRHAFVFSESDAFKDGDLSRTFQFTVPEGKRLVLEAVSMHAFLPEDQTLTIALVRTRVNEQNLGHSMGPTSHGKNPGGLLLSLVSAERTLYADGGTEVSLTAQRSADDGSGTFSASVSGHLIDCEVGVCE